MKLQKSLRYKWPMIGVPSSPRGTLYDSNRPLDCSKCPFIAMVTDFHSQVFIMKAIKTIFRSRPMANVNREEDNYLRLSWHLETSLPPNKTSYRASDVRPLSINSSFAINYSHYSFFKFPIKSLCLSLQIRQLPESVIIGTTEYKCLQSQFSVLYNESMQIKKMLDETRNQL